MNEKEELVGGEMEVRTVAIEYVERVNYHFVERYDLVD